MLYYVYIYYIDIFYQAEYKPRSYKNVLLVHVERRENIDLLIYLLVFIYFFFYNKLQFL